MSERAIISLAAAPPALRRKATFELPATGQLLTEGGDSRITIDLGKTRNKYGCAPHPDPAIAAFGSSTASTISPRGFAAADRLRGRLIAAADWEKGAVTYGRELDRLRIDLADLCGIADLAGLEIVFAASGTDLHLLAAQLAGGTATAPLRSIMVEPRETGSGVAVALAGRHFSTLAALGSAVHEGDPLGDATISDVAAIALRDGDGGLRAADSIEAQIDDLATEAAGRGQRVLLTMVDVSKTGIIAPRPAYVAALVQRLPQAVEILVDACQFRLAPATLRAYLERGFMVAVTGSKFLTGPAFAGALLIPGEVARRLRLRRLPPALRCYSAQAEWPRGWAAATTLADVENYGLLLRWEAAMQELHAFRAVPEAAVAEFAAKFARAVTERLASDPAFEPLPPPSLERLATTPTGGWDAIQMIFPFFLRHVAGPCAAKIFRREEVAATYRWLGRDARGIVEDPADDALAALPCELGQPVPCGTRDGNAVSVLRICNSARLIVEATQGAAATAAVIARAMTAFDKVALVARAVSQASTPSV
ncbi:MAG: hypothetical protein JWL84_4591 [Rhodospirillales bacterium]|nr:hypothetical protein [Rhodospirillales bacterium]